MFGLIGMYISVPKLDAAFLQNVSVDLLATYFGIPLEKDEEVSRGIYMAKPVRNAFLEYANADKHHAAHFFSVASLDS